MRAVVQRVHKASVAVDGATVAEIATGVLVLVGVAEGDTREDASYLATKIAHLRIFPDAEGQMNRSVLDAGGQALVVSQFTLLGDCRKGRRPSYSHAARPEDARTLYAELTAAMRTGGLDVREGVFQAMMDVSLVNYGPVTLLLDSRRGF